MTLHLYPLLSRLGGRWLAFQISVSGQVGADLTACIENGLIDRAPIRPILRHHRFYRDAVDHDRDEEEALVIRQRFGHGTSNGGDQFPLLCLGERIGRAWCRKSLPI